jgi:23S rRNA (adenine2503-C2)-methyltransferase
MQTDNISKPYLLDFSRDELCSFMQQFGIEKYRADQLHRGIYVQKISDLSHLSTISKPLRQKIKQISILRTFTLKALFVSTRDHTTKFLWSLFDNKEIESVIIYEGKRVTFCISSQVGCALDCKFCATGKMGFLRNLRCGEMVEQVLLMSSHIKIAPSNIVFMGMGEPLLNMKNVIKACDIISDPKGLAISRKKITISTSGIVQNIRKLADMKTPYSLAISLNAAFEEKRKTLMPITYKHSLNDLSAAIKYYTSKTRRRVSLEYILISNTNDGKADADALVKFSRGFPCKINLIPSNTTDLGMLPPSTEIVEWFNEYLNSKNITVTIRGRKGWDIQAACGQLYSKNEKNIGAKVSFVEKKRSLSK